jgi:hypothetical protein
MSYWVGEGPAGDGTASVEVRDGTGTVIRELEGSARHGVNRAVWDLHVDGEEEGELGDEVVPGTYQVTVRVGSDEATVPVVVVADPRKEGVDFFLTPGGR